MVTSCSNVLPAAVASLLTSIAGAATAASKKAAAGKRHRPLTRWSSRKASADVARPAANLFVANNPLKLQEQC